MVAKRRVLEASGGHTTSPSSMVILQSLMRETTASSSTMGFQTPPAPRLGQADFESVDHNRGRYWPDEKCMNMPYALAAWDNLLVVGDTASSRQLGFEAPLRSGVDSVATHLAGPDHFGMKGDPRRFVLDHRGRR